jgi:hypothetical protein
VIGGKYPFSVCPLKLILSLSSDNAFLLPRGKSFMAILRKTAAVAETIALPYSHSEKEWRIIRLIKLVKSLSKTAEIYRHVSDNVIGKIRNPLANLNILEKNKGCNPEL